MKTTVIHHSADYDGLFCREIARKFLPTDTEFIGWDFADKPLDSSLLHSSELVILDLPVDRIFGLQFKDGWICRGDEQIQPIDRWASSNIIWIDHHKSSIESHPKDIPGYRIDGVAACRLAWQWFKIGSGPDTTNLPDKSDYIDRKVIEPLAVRLAGEYDIWDHRGDGDLEFQFGLDCWPNLPWKTLLAPEDAGPTVNHILQMGKAAMSCYAKRDADVMKSRSFLVEWEGLKFLALNTARCNSKTFAARDVPATGHDALMVFYVNDKVWTFSLYHANHRKDLDLSLIAVKHGGGGHRGACGFTATRPPWQNNL